MCGTFASARYTTCPRHTDGAWVTLLHGYTFIEWVTLSHGYTFSTRITTDVGYAVETRVTYGHRRFANEDYYQPWAHLLFRGYLMHAVHLGNTDY